MVQYRLIIFRAIVKEYPIKNRSFEGTIFFIADASYQILNFIKSVLLFLKVIR